MAAVAATPSLRKTPTYLRFTTPHYKFELTLTETMTPFHAFRYVVGNPKDPCLEGVITLENMSKNSRLNDATNTATLYKIKALQECSLEDINSEYLAKHSFGTELLEAVKYFINSQFPSIRTVSFNDASYIPCIADDYDTLDLLIYSIALYGYTWYEQKIGAYTKDHEKYRSQVDIYTSKETKSRTEFIEIYKLIMKSGSSFSQEIVDKRYAEFENAFARAETLPEFFRFMNKAIDRRDRCRFFKTWLENFIQGFVTVERQWYFDLFPKIEEVASITRRNKTLKRKNLNSKIKT